MINLDRTDLSLLSLLQKEGRLSNALLAERVNLSPSACLRRVQRLEESGVIEGYGARLSTEKLSIGLQAFVRVQLAKHDAESIATFVGHIGNWDEVIACFALTGEMDYLLHVMVQDLQHFSQFLLDRLLNNAGVADVNSSFVLRVVKPHEGVPLSHLR
jgi:Lrp/AsnC family transcriptional regulator, leucine-responsive regulatory protein